MVCLEALNALQLKWKYALNAAGSELQLANNRQVVELLSRNPGNILVNSEPMPSKEKKRLKKKYELQAPGEDPSIAPGKFPLVPVGPADPVPFNMTVFKGRKSYKLPREFVRFLLRHPVANVSKGGQVPQHETFSALLPTLS